MSLVLNAELKEKTLTAGSRSELSTSQTTGIPGICMHCGSSVPPAMPEGEFMGIAAAPLDDSPKIKPDKHIFIVRTPQRDEISNDLPQLIAENLASLRRITNDYNMPHPLLLKLDNSRRKDTATFRQPFLSAGNLPFQALPWPGEICISFVTHQNESKSRLYF